MNELQKWRLEIEISVAVVQLMAFIHLWPDLSALVHCGEFDMHLHEILCLTHQMCQKTNFKHLKLYNFVLFVNIWNVIFMNPCGLVLQGKACKMLVLCWLLFNLIQVHCFLTICKLCFHWVDCAKLKSFVLTKTNRKFFESWLWIADNLSTF